MNKITLLNMDNMDFETDEKFNLIYGDMIYEDANLSWIGKYWHFLAPNGIFIVQTDYHTSAEVHMVLKMLANQYGGEFIAEVIYKQEWGGVPAKGFPIKHDNIYIFSNGSDWKWYGDRIQIPKKTVSKGMNPSGRTTKTPCSVFDDLGNFSTMDSERIKNGEGKNIRWQKPLKLMRRLMLPFLDNGDKVLDPFMGVASTGIVAKEIGCSFVGIELDEIPYKLAQERMNGI